MAAPEGNKFAEKWTREASIELIEKVNDFIDSNPNEIHLGSSLVECGGYPDLWAYLTDKFRNEEEVFRAIKRIEIKLEARIVKGTMSGVLKSAAMGIFYLKNKHDYSDKQEVEQTVKNELSDKSLDELLKIANELSDS